jgi:putative transposase
MARIGIKLFESERKIIMSIATKEVIRDLIKQQNFSSTTEIMAEIKEMFRDVLQEVMEAELETELGYEKHERVSENGEETVSKNYRNGYSKKTVRTQLGEVEVNVPRDRNGEYTPQIIGKYNRNADGMEEKILSLYAAGMSQRDIAEQIKKLYDVEISAELVSKISDKIIPQLNEWQNRPLESVYPFVFMDAIHYKIRENHQIVTKAAYVVLGVTLEGYKEILGIWVGGNESSKFWLSVLNELKSRGIKDVYLFCVDGLSGFREAIAAVYPQAGIQRCIIHQIRSCMKYVNYKHMKQFAADLKLVYTSVTEESALNALMSFKDKWGAKYPAAVKSWEDNWDILSTFFAYPPAIRKIIYTTNIIEGLHRQFRKVTKTKAVFPTDDSLRKMLYLASNNIVKKWTQRYREWDMVLNHLALLFEGRQAV